MGSKKDYKKMTKDEIVKAEKKKFDGICKKMDAKTKKAVSSLVDEACFMGASLFELRILIDKKGFTEEYQNGANQKGVKKTSEVEIYNTMIKNYMNIIKQLTDLLPKEVRIKEDDDGFDSFVNEKNK